MRISELRNICRRETDYFFTILVTNELSLVLTHFLIKTSITPNKISFLSVLSGFLSGFSYALGNFWFGSIFIFISHILDCTDGNLARAKKQFCPNGKWIDMVGDRLSHSVIFLCISYYYYNSADSIIWSYCALIDIILLLNYYYAVDMAIAQKLFPKKKRRFKLKGVPIRYGLYEPVIYGFVFLSPIGMTKLHLVLILISVSFGLVFQYYSIFKKRIT